MLTAPTMTHPSEHSAAGANPTIRLAIVEDNPTMRRLLAATFSQAADFEVCASFSSAEEAHDHTGWGEVDVVLVDLELPGMPGTNFISWLQRHHPLVRAVAYTAHDNEEVFFQAIRAGALGYVVKDGNLQELPNQLRSVKQGGAALSPRVAIMMVRAIGQPVQAKQLEPLSLREIELLKLFAAGLRYKEVGSALSISANTVHTHASRIYAKLDVSNRKEALRIARLAGLI